MRAGLIDRRLPGRRAGARRGAVLVVEVAGAAGEVGGALHALANHGLVGQIAQEAAGKLVAGAPEQRARLGVGDEQPLAGPGDGHIGQAALFFEIVDAVGIHAPVRKGLFLQTGQNHRGELEPLGGVDRHQRDAGHARHHRAGQRHPFEPAEQGRRLAAGRRAFLVLADRADQLLQVLEPRVALGRVFFAQARTIAGGFEHVAGELAG